MTPQDGPEQLRAVPVRPPASAARAIELIEAQSALAQHGCAPAAEARRLGMHADTIGAATIVLTRKSTNLYYNRVTGLGQASPATEAQVDRALALARDHRVKALAVNVGRNARPRALSRWLKERGFRRAQPSAKLWRDAAPLSEPGPAAPVRVRQVRPSQASTWGVGPTHSQPCTPPQTGSPGAHAQSAFVGLEGLFGGAAPGELGGPFLSQP